MSLSSTKTIFTPTKLGDIEIANRVIMAPLTRSRADDGSDTPSDLAIDYYRQRASAGLIISEATQISPTGKGYISTPGLYTDAHEAKWREITDAVRAEGGRMISQLWHVGRVSHTSILPAGEQPVAPSAILADTSTFTKDGPTPVSAPRALTLDELPGIVADYVAAARRAIRAGFDGVEVHAANGYLLDQFLRDGSNQRDDIYGGSIENRMRFVLEVVDAVVDAVGAGRVGIRLSPTGTFGDMKDSDPAALFGALIDALNARGLAYLHIVEEFAGQISDEDRALLASLRDRFTGAYIANGGYTLDKGEAAVSSGHATAVSYGVPFIGNPDLVARFANGWPLADSDQASWYGGTDKGYVDYQPYRAAAA